MDKSRSDRIARAVREHLDAGNSLLALLLFGSRVSGAADVDSDYDILAITRFHQPSRVIVADEMTLDVIFGSPVQFQRKMQHRSINNDNFTLNNFAVSSILWDPDGMAERMRRRAKQEYAEGPRALEAKEAAEVARALKKMLRVVASRIQRSQRSPEENLLNIFRIEEIVAKAIFAYFRAEREWTQAFYKVVREQLPGHVRLHELWLQHVKTVSDTEAHLESAIALIGHVEARLLAHRDSPGRREEGPMNLGHIDVLDD